ncbi:MAG: mechanosensitive ion channel family protein [Clostridiaceae bacterium]|nr:mechanosensitive ion channel family protein [Clostridiaceae bacterium]NLM14363.1 mechanosensitive ion channel family protein [Clostridiaceae bacterium]
MIYAVRVWVDSANYWQIRFDVIEQVKQRFDEEGIVIPLPTSLDIQLNQ